MCDVAIIGGGIVGCSIAEVLSRYELDVRVIDREPDVASGTTKANSGIVHAGYDAPPGTLMAKLNVEGCESMEEECRRLDAGYRRVGSLVLSLRPEDDEMLEALLERGRRNGVRELEILSPEAAREREPSLNPEVRGALWAPGAGIVDPFVLCVARAETAAANGADFLLGREVLGIRAEEEGYVIETSGGDVRARWIVNAAGVHADQIQEMAGEKEFSIKPVRGEYYVMDRQMGDFARSVIFQCPGPEGKGVLVAPTVHGNVIIGPNAEDVDSRDDTATTREGQDYVRRAAARSTPGIDYRLAIRNFAGVRAHSDAGDFIVGMSKSAPRFLNLAGICSPGLTAAGPIARAGVRILERNGLRLIPKRDPVMERKTVRMKTLTPDEKSARIQEDPTYGRVVCRCETVTEGEIRAALRRRPAPRTVDAVKKRLGAGMGRCQGGFCAPRVMRIISEELDVPQTEILLGAEGSRILTGELK